jgi:hypothetical protein
MQTPYEGGTKVWSNRYHVTGGDWQDQTHFNTYSDLLTASLKTILTPRTTIIETVGYNTGSDLPVFSKTYSLAGTFAASSNPYAPLENCALVRFSTDARSAKNHPIYLYKYWHDAQTDALATPDLLRVGQRSTMGGIASDIISGFSDGSLTRKLAGPNGAVALGQVVAQYLHHRDFPR